MSGGEIPAGLAAALADRYVLAGVLGRGATATVYLAEDARHGRQVAIKVLDRALAEAIGPERFRREIETAARLTHPNLMPLFDSGEADGQLWYAMPYIPGESLRARLVRETKLPLGDALTIAREVADALAHAHEHGLVHRDVKPENILLTSGHALLADFGISRALRAGAPADAPTVMPDAMTVEGMSLGTPRYMAPEQFASSSRVDGRADVYSLGCVLYEMLAGEPPFGGPDLETIQARHALDPVPPLRTRRPGVSGAIESAIVRALAKVPADRPDARHFAEELARAERAGAAGAVGPAVAKPPQARRRLAVAGAIVLGVGVLAVVAWRSGLLDRMRGPLGEAERNWVLLAAFEGPADDPSLAVVARDLVAAALDQSGSLATLPPDQVRSALRLAGRSDTTRVTGDLARELAYRSSIRVVVEGTVHRVGAGYSTVLRAVDAERGTPVVTVSETARDVKDLVPALGRVAARLRRGLGEKPESLARTRPLVEAATPSFEAYKLYVHARDLINASDPISARSYYRAALALDSAFALAWVGLGTSYSNREHLDSAQWAFDRAQRHVDRLSEVRRLDLIAKRARLVFDYPAALSAYNRALELDPSPVERSAFENNRANILELSGRLEEAVVAYESAARVLPVETPMISVRNKTGVLIGLGRTEDVRAELPRLRGTPLSEAVVSLSVLEGNLARADSVAAVLAEDTAKDPDERVLFEGARAGFFIARGAWRRADEAIETASRLGLETGQSDPRGFVIWGDLLIDDLRHRKASPLSGAESLQVFLATFEGDSNRVRADARKFSSAFHTEFRPEFLAMIEGFLALRKERWADAIRVLAPPARQARQGGWLYDSLRNRARWAVATAFERTGQPDSAAFYLESILRPRLWSFSTIVEKPLYEPFVRQRLVRLAIARGRADEARAQWEALQRTMVQPDADASRFLDETRHALTMGGGPGSGEGR